MLGWKFQFLHSVTTGAHILTQSVYNVGGGKKGDNSQPKLRVYTWLKAVASQVSTASAAAAATAAADYPQKLFFSTSFFFVILGIKSVAGRVDIFASRVT